MVALPYRGPLEGRVLMLPVLVAQLPQFAAAPSRGLGFSRGAPPIARFFKGKAYSRLEEKKKK